MISTLLSLHPQIVLKDNYFELLELLQIIVICDLLIVSSIPTIDLNARK